MSTEMKLSKSEAHKLIDGERAYQDKIYPDARSIGEEILLLDVFVTKAKLSLYLDGNSAEYVMEVIREIAAIAQRAIERHGVDERFTEDDFDEEDENTDEESPF